MIFVGGPLIDYGLGDDLVPLHSVFAFEIGLIKTFIHGFKVIILLIMI
jgi:hypothetical protein